MGVRTRSESPLAGYSRTYLVFFALVAILAVTGAAMAAAPQEGGSQTVMAEFENVGPITNQTAVRIGGTDVGTTGQPTVDADRRLAVLPLNLDANAFPLYRNASAKIDQLSLIGEKYVELTPGTPDAGVMAPGEPIRVQQTSLAEDYQNLVQPLNDPTAAGLASLVRELGQGVAGRGKNVQEIIRQLTPGAGETDKLLASINRQNGVLGQIVDQVQPLVNGLAADQGRTLDSTLTSANTLLDTTTVNEQNLQATIAELPSTLAAAQRTLGTLTGTAGDAEETLRELRPTTDNLANISRELRGFTDAANPALKALNPLLEDANRLLDEARPLAAELRRTGEPLFDVVHNARPNTTSLTNNIGGPYGEGPDPTCFNTNATTEESIQKTKEACLNPRVQGILGFLHNFALFTNAADGFGHYGRLFTVIDAVNEIPVEGTNNTYLPCAFRGPGSNPFYCVDGKPRGPVPGGFDDDVKQGMDDYGDRFDGGKGDKDKGKRDAEKAKADAKMSALGKAVPELNNTILRGDPQAGGSATGLTPTQEQNALGTLMGGR